MQRAWGPYESSRSRSHGQLNRDDRKMPRQQEAFDDGLSDDEPDRRGAGLEHPRSIPLVNLLHRTHGGPSAGHRTTSSLDKGIRIESSETDREEHGPSDGTPCFTNTLGTKTWA